MSILRHKFNAVRTEVDGFKFDSKAEARYYERLKERQAAGEVVGFLRQVPFHLPGGVRYVVDFLEFHVDGSVHFIEIKGFATSEFKIKLRLMQALYPWATIETVKA